MIIKYETGCRDCMATDGIPSIYSIFDDNPQNWISKAEYEVVKIIENWRERDQLCCTGCGSHNVEVTDVLIDGKPLYNFEKLSERCIPANLFMIDITKKMEIFMLNLAGIIMLLLNLN